MNATCEFGEDFLYVRYVCVSVRVDGLAGCAGRTDKKLQ